MLSRRIKERGISVAKAEKTIFQQRQLEGSVNAASQATLKKIIDSECYVRNVDMLENFPFPYRQTGRAE